MLRAILRQTIRYPSRWRSSFEVVRNLSSDSSDKDGPPNETKDAETGSGSTHVSIPRPKGYKTLLKEQTRFVSLKSVKNIEQAAELVSSWIGIDPKEIKKELLDREQTVSLENIRDRSAQRQCDEHCSYQVARLKCITLLPNKKCSDLWEEEVLKVQPKPAKQKETLLSGNLHNTSTSRQNVEMIQTKSNNLLYIQYRKKCSNSSKKKLVDPNNEPGTQKKTLYYANIKGIKLSRQKVQFDQSESNDAIRITIYTNAVTRRRKKSRRRKNLFLMMFLAGKSFS